MTLFIQQKQQQQKKKEDKNQARCHFDVLNQWLVTRMSQYVHSAKVLFFSSLFFTIEKKYKFGFFWMQNAFI